MKRKIYLDGERYASCEVNNYGDVEVYLFGSSVDMHEVAMAMGRNGFFVKQVFADEEDEEYASIVVDRQKFRFKGEDYTLNQCSDIFDWFGESQVGDFTYYYDRVVFHTSLGFYAAYINDTSNYIRV